MVTKKLIEVMVENCIRCSNEWIPRKANPKNCPKCNSPYWNKERVYPKKVLADVKIIQ